jgi:hypothetical protein
MLFPQEGVRSASGIGCLLPPKQGHGPGTFLFLLPSRLNKCIHRMLPPSLRIAPQAQSVPPAPKGSDRGKRKHIEPTDNPDYRFLLNHTHLDGVGEGDMQ